MNRIDSSIPIKSGAEIRKSFIDFFVKRDHQFVRSAPVVPHDDPTLLFTNSGMNQFKGIFLGENPKGLKRAANSQKCLRVSGKHNDLDEVGRDTYHHTFFEMLGNWSFGDYYKEESIAWAWELLTNVWGLPKDRLFATVYRDDDESEMLWKKLTDIDHRRILRFGEKENFWEMGDVGPCGPCTEIHFDMGDAATREQTFADKILGVNGKNHRYIELWNLVFMQFERQKNGSLVPLKDKHVDTGMGFERVCSVIQGSGSNYETDIFMPIIDLIAKKSGRPYVAGAEGTAHRVIADHLRALTFAIADGATPGNEGRGYVLRRILRRASRFAGELGQKQTFIHTLVPKLVEIMGEAYPELGERQDYVQQVIEAEESRFIKTLDSGLQRFHKVASAASASSAKQIKGEDVFALYDTFGFPTDLTAMLAEEQGLTIDQEGYTLHMTEQRERARSKAKFDDNLMGDEGWTIVRSGTTTNFVGYEKLQAKVSVLRYREVGDTVMMMLDQTPFYAESGGQVGDIGTIQGNNVVLKVIDTFKMHEFTVHKCELVSGLITSKNLDLVEATVDGAARLATVSNHSATHLLQSALQKVLGNHIQQQGSRVGPEGLRFDFTHPKSLSRDELDQIEDLVNEKIQENLAVSVAFQAIDEAKASGATALFGEKYGDIVRVVDMDGFSRELCGGTHAKATGQIGMFRISSESSIASGVRRIEACTGRGALLLSRQQENCLLEAARILKAKPSDVPAKVDDVTQKLKSAEKELKALHGERVNLMIDGIIAQRSIAVGNGRFLTKDLDSQVISKEHLNLLVDGIAAKFRDGVAVLTWVDGEQMQVLVTCGEGIRGRIKASDVVKEVGKVADAKGGGRPDRAQAGSKQPEKVGAVLKSAEQYLRGQLS